MCVFWMMYMEPFYPSVTYLATYDVQHVKLHDRGGNLFILCVFASGSQAQGCHMEIRNSSIEVNITRSGRPLSHTAEKTVTGLAQGSYEVLIYDWESDGSLSSSPSYTAHTNVSGPALPTSVSINEVNNSSAPTTVTGSDSSSMAGRRIATATKWIDCEHLDYHYSNYTRIFWPCCQKISYT